MFLTSLDFDKYESKSELKFYLGLPLKQLKLSMLGTPTNKTINLFIEAPCQGLENKQAFQDRILLQNDI